MDEREWLGCTDPKPMLEYVGGKEADPRVRLFLLACCRRLSRLLTPGTLENLDALDRCWDPLQLDDIALQASYDAERAEWACRTRPGGYEGGAPDRRRAAALAARAVRYAVEGRTGSGSMPPGEGPTASGLLDAAAQAVGHEAAARWGDGRAAEAGERRAQAALLRCLFGNFVRPVRLDPSWRSRDVWAVAEAAYEQGGLPQGTPDPTTLAVLADALEEAGCRDEQVLGHLRGPGPHARGCWVVDLLLGKD
jgi:hypothetical protein